MEIDPENLILLLEMAYVQGELAVVDGMPNDHKNRSERIKDIIKLAR